MQPNLSTLDRLKIQLQRYVHVREDTKPGWKDSLPFYAFKCPEHGIVVNSPQGHNNRLLCPKCLKDLHLQQELMRHDPYKHELDQIVDQTRNMINAY